jgi:cytochrome c oxidase subunit 4
MSNQSSPAETQADAHGGEHLGHVVPIKVLVGVWIALVVLTWVTVAVTYRDWGGLNLWVAMAIATVKASLVAMYFMHLRYDNPFHAIILVSALLFVMLFIGLALMDTLQYQPDLIPGHAPALER